MKIAIVGTSHLTDEEKDKALIIIETIIERARTNKDEIITGDANGIDHLVCILMPAPSRIFKAKVKEWSHPDGFKQRNIRIAQEADFIYSISTKVKKTRCYHCDISNHERTGGCWTLRFGRDKLGKKGEVIII